MSSRGPTTQLASRPIVNGVPTGAPRQGADQGAVHVQDVSGLLGQAGPTRNQLPPLRCQPHRRAPDQAARAATVDEMARNSAAAAHLSTFAGLIVPFGSVIGPLAVWLTRRDRDPFIDQAGREALNFGITIAIYGSVLLVAALMLVGIPLLIVGVVAWVVLASLAAVKASQGQAYRYPLTLGGWSR